MDLIKNFVPSAYNAHVKEIKWLFHFNPELQRCKDFIMRSGTYNLDV